MALQTALDLLCYTPPMVPGSLRSQLRSVSKGRTYINTTCSINEARLSVPVKDPQPLGGTSWQDIHQKYVPLIHTKFDLWTGQCVV